MAESESSHNESSSIDYHLTYLDEFLQLRCAPDIIEMGLFPNAKEITESFAIWAAIRRHIFPQLSTSTSPVDNRQNAIIVVGDGMTPRTAALCAYLTKGLWQCFSIDPMLQYDTYTDMIFLHRRSTTTADHCKEWTNIRGLRMARAKIQAVSIQCRQAIVVMMHAHVSIEDAIAAVDTSEGIVGIVTCPCCNWAAVQETWLDQAPQQQYTDVKLLSAKNQMNVWCFPQGCQNKSSTVSTHSINNTTAERSIWGLETTMMETILSTRDGVKQRAIDLWPQIFSKGIKAFNTSDLDQSSDDLNIWPWGSTTWSPKDISPVMKSCSALSTASSWLGKPILLIGTIASMRRCKHSIFYELNTCAIPSEQLENILRSTCHSPSMINTTEKDIQASNDTFPELLKSADRIWSCVEYQRHLQALASYDSTVERKTKKANLQTTTIDNDRVNIILSLSSYQEKTASVASLQQSDDRGKVKLFHDNPQPRQSLFPWAMHLRPSDILVAYCVLGRNASLKPQLCLIDGILLFDSMINMIGIDRRTLR